MKKKVTFIISIILVVAIIFFIKSYGTKNIKFSFDLSEVMQIEMYHYEGVPAAEECKIITKKEDIETLFYDLQKIKVRDLKENSESLTGGSAIRFEFLLADKSIYTLESANDGVHQTVKLPAENIQYTTSANIEKYWKQFSYEVVEKHENEDEFLSIDEYNETYEAKKNSMEEAFANTLYTIHKHSQMV